MLRSMKINIKTILAALGLGQKIYGEWQKLQKESQPSQPAPSSQQKKQGNFGNFGAPGQAAPQASTQPSSQQTSWEEGNYPGDYRGKVNFLYSPTLDGDADPGEIVWAWVPYQEDHSQGKDRPVLIVGREGNYLLGLMLTSKDHSNSRVLDPNYLDIGSGPWDKEGRPSEVKLNRVIRLLPQGIRREGAVMPQATFDFIAQAYSQN